jgi:hypothetical protein
MILNILSVTGWIIATMAWTCLLLLHYPRPNLGGEQAMGYGLGLFACSIGLGVGLMVMTSSFIWREAVTMPMALMAVAGAISYSRDHLFLWRFAYRTRHMDPGTTSVVGHRGRFNLDSGHYLSRGVYLGHAKCERGRTKSGCGNGHYRFTSGVSALALAIYLLTWMVGLPERQKALLEAHNQEDAARHQQHLEEIAAWQPESGILPLLALTGRFHDQPVRKAAVERVQSVKDWEQQLIQLLESAEYYYHVYTFLDGNEVENPTIFIPALQSSIRRMAMDIQMQIHNANNLSALDLRLPGDRKAYPSDRPAV